MDLNKIKEDCEKRLQDGFRKRYEDETMHDYHVAWAKWEDGLKNFLEMVNKQIRSLEIH